MKTVEVVKEEYEGLKEAKKRYFDNMQWAKFLIMLGLGCYSIFKGGSFVLILALMLAYSMLVFFYGDEK